MLATVGIAALSWQVFEGPINRLKRRFPYEKPPRHKPIIAAAADPAAAR